MLENLKRHLNIQDDLYILDKPTRGLVSKKTIQKDELIIVIPKKFIIKPSVIPFFSELETKIHKNSIFAYFLLLESKNKNSYWNFFFKSFPKKKSFENEYPLYLKKDIRNDIKDTEFGELLTEYEKTIQHDFEILKKFSSDKKIKYTDFLYYRLLVTSRMFGYENDTYMVPYIELCNHSKNANCIWFYKYDHFCLMATKRIPKGSEILVSYGDKPNKLLYLFYGFTQPQRKKSKQFQHIKNEHLQNILP